MGCALGRLGRGGGRPPVVSAPGREQRHANLGMGGRAVGEQTTRRSCTDDHVVPGPGSFRHSALLCLPENPMSSTEKLKLGLKGTADLVVREEHTAPRVGSGRVHVLATPVMINVIEAAALAAIEPLLPEGRQSLGPRLQIPPFRAPPLGMPSPA